MKMADPQLKAYYIFGAVIQARQLQALVAELEGVRRAEDMECIHRMRVASRRLRAAQSLFDGFLPGQKAKRWEKEIRRVTRALGQARDLDVQLDAFNAFAQTHTEPSFKPGIRRLMLRINQQRNLAQQKVISALQQLEESSILPIASARLQALAEQVDQVYLYTPYLYQTAFQKINGRLENMLSYAPYIYQPDKAAELHAMRIMAKRLRYTMEIFSPLYPGALKEPLHTVREMQELLGNLHDADMWLIYLPAFLESERQMTVAFYGRLRNYSSIQPAVQAFVEDRTICRENAYHQVVDCWEKAHQQDIWTHLHETLQIPWNLEHPAKVTSVENVNTEEKNENCTDQ
jgi:CHAD domain-containing protein